MSNEHTIHVIKKVRVFVYPVEYFHSGDNDAPTKHKATIYDGGTQLKKIHGETEEDARYKAVRWVYENFSIPNSVTIRQELPRLAVEYFNEQTRLRQGVEEEE